MAHLPDLFKNNHSLFKDVFSELDDLFSAPAAPIENTDAQWLKPTFDVAERENDYLLSVDIPGVKREDLKVEGHGRMITISGERRERTGSAKSSASSRRYGSFSRTFNLPEGVSADDVKAHYEDGQLEVVIPKAQASSRKSIEIKTGRADADMATAAKDPH